MSDVVVRLVGGLGNQMFQYAAARAVAIRRGARLQLDTDWFLGSAERRYALAPFRIQAEVSQSRRSPGVLQRGLVRLVDRVWVPGRSSRRDSAHYVEKDFSFDPEVLTLRIPVRMEGYFQSEKYFQDVRGTIAHELSLREPVPPQSRAVLQDILGSEAICLHVRRGDYVSNPATAAFHGVCSLEYYREGLRIVAAGFARPKCFVFSDDPNWVRKHLHLDVPLTIIDAHGPDLAHEDLRLMSACRRFVIANSSFSWWAAWMGNHPDKRVVAPMQWFKGSRNDIRDLLPIDWMRA